MTTKLTAMVVFGGLLALGWSAQADTCEDLLLHYSFDGFAGGVAQDLSGNGNDGTVSFATATPGILGEGISFENGGYIDAGQILGVSDVNPVLTVSAWVMGGGESDNDFVIGKQEELFPNRGWSIGVGAEVRASLVAVRSAQEAVAVDDLDIRDGEWHHVVAVFESQPTLLRTLLYVDGELRSTADYIGAHSSLENVARLWIGKQYPGFVEGFLGSVDEVRIYGRALGADEVLALFQSADADLCGPVADERPWLTRIGFSSDPAGDQDVTEFYVGETLHVAVADAQVTGGMKLVLKQGGGFSWWNRGRHSRYYDFEADADGTWRAAAPLDGFDPGKIEVSIISLGKDASIWRSSQIYLNE